MEYPKILNPRNLTAENVHGEVVQIGEITNYKPSAAKYSDGSLVLFTVHWHIEPGLSGGRKVWHSVMYRSFDDGKSWSVGKHMPFVGHEPSAFVIDDVLFVHTHVFHFDAGFYVTLMIYRSEDHGETWNSFEISSELLTDGADRKISVAPARTIFQLTSGELLWFVIYKHKEYRVSSTDLGLHWKFREMKPSDPAIQLYNAHNSGTVSCEAVTFYSSSDRLLKLGRIEWQDFGGCNIPYAIKLDRYYGSDEGDGLILMESFDEGYTWKILRGVGISGMMYPSVHVLDEHRFILQYTMRIVPSEVSGYPYRHMGVHAIIVTENADGTFDIDFDHDLLIIDDRTPDYSTQGGGYGMIVPLADGTLLSPYSYRELIPQLSDDILNKRWKNREYLEYFWHRVGKSQTTWESWCKLSEIDQFNIFMDDALETREAMFLSQVLRWKLDVK